MEWSFIVAAVRRRIRFVVLCAILGAVPGLLSIANSVSSYEAVATIGIATPTSGAGAAVAASQPDRYITSQLSVVTSTDTLEKAAKKLGGGVTAAQIAEQLTVEQEPSADIITVKATASRPKAAAAIANAIADVYITEAASREAAARAPRIQTLQDKLDAITTQLTTPDKSSNTQVKIFKVGGRETAGGAGVTACSMRRSAAANRRARCRTVRSLHCLNYRVFWLGAAPASLNFASPSLSWAWFCPSRGLARRPNE